MLHKNEKTGYFVYAGYVFLSKEERDSAKREYCKANRAIKVATGMEGELKASVLKPKHKRSLFNSLRKYNSVSAVVSINRIYDHILSNKLAICRYKDYVLKICVKRKLEDLIRQGKISSQDDVDIHIFVDEQLTASNGYYSLKDSITEELRHGIANFDYGVQHPKVFTGSVKVTLRYCESKNNYLIQASDIIANRIWSSYRLNKPEMREIDNHVLLTFP